MYLEAGFLMFEIFIKKISIDQKLAKIKYFHKNLRRNQFQKIIYSVE